MTWFDVLTGQNAARPAFPASKKPAGRQKTLAALGPSSISSTSSTHYNTAPQEPTIKHRRKRCFNCEHWQIIKGGCWWAGICGQTGAKVFFRTTCTQEANT